MRLRRKYKYIIFGLEKKGMDGRNTIYDWKFFTPIHNNSSHSTSTNQTSSINANAQSSMNNSTNPTTISNGTPASTTPIPMTRQGDNRIPMMNQSGTSTNTQRSAETTSQNIPSDTMNSNNTTGGNMDNATAWNMMMKELPHDDARFILFDYTAKATDNRNLNKIILIKYCPDNANVNIKMLMGSTHETLKRNLTGIAKDVQACDSSEMDYKTISDSLLGV